MKKTTWLALILGVLGLWLFVLPVQADGIIIPDNPPYPCPQGSPGCAPIVPCIDQNVNCPPCAQGTVCAPCLPPRPCPPPVNPFIQLGIKYHHVTVTIDNQLATTKVDQIFYNPNSWAVEGIYIFPLPQGATVNNFMLWVDGQPVEGNVMDASQARQVYEEITRQQRDPALLEYVGRGAVQASIFPIPPNGERRIQLEFVQTLTAENGLVQYLYPLNTEKFSSRPIDDVSIMVSITSQQPLRAIYSPSHTIQVDRPDDTHATISYEEQNVRPDVDFNLYYSLGTSEAFHLFTYRDPNDVSDPDGFFLMLLAPRPDENQVKVAKDVILVLDHSGSMDGEKSQLAQAALSYILKHLNQEDRFGIVAFSSEVQKYADGLRNADEAPEAIAWANQISARGSTDINRALLEAVAMADKERPTYLIFLTDGLPTVGETDRDKIIANFNQASPSSIRLFAFGVGYDVDTYLLDTLTQGHHGRSTYVQPGQNLDEVVSGFYQSISTPVLTNLALDFGSLATYDVYPNPLPDLFASSQVVVAGRYREGGTVDVTLKGDVNGQSQSLSFPSQAFTSDSGGVSDALTSLPRLWATRKVGYLLNKIRLEGVDKESVDQIVNLSIRYGIVTPYTSYLVTEPSPLGMENQERVAQQAYENYLAAPAQSTGKSAVDQAAGAGGMSQAQQAPALPSTNLPGSTTNEQTIQVVGSRTFVYNQGTWTDTAFDPQSMQPVQVSFLSTDYFKLVAARADLASAFALGEKVIVIVDGKAYAVVADNTSVPPVEIPPTVPAPTAAVMQPGQITPTPGTPVLVTPSITPDVVSGDAGPWSPLTIAGFIVVVIAAAYLMLRRK